VAGGGGDGHASRLQLAGGAGGTGFEERSLFGASVRVPGAAWGFVEDHLVGRPGRVPVRQAPGEGPVRVAVGIGGQGELDGGPVVDVAGGHRLAHAGPHMAAPERRISTG